MSYDDIPYYLLIVVNNDRLIYIQKWKDIVLQSLSYLVADEVVLDVQNDDPAYVIMSLRTLIDNVIQRVTMTVKDELPGKSTTKENSRGMLLKKKKSKYYNILFV